MSRPTIEQPTTREQLERMTPLAAACLRNEMARIHRVGRHESQERQGVDEAVVRGMYFGGVSTNRIRRMFGISFERAKRICKVTR